MTSTALDTLQTLPSRKAASLCPEILYQIFLALFNDKTSWSTISPLVQFPWNIAAVCQTWRAASLASPKLWTRFLAVDRWHSCKLVNKRCILPLPIVRYYLQIERAQSMPLIVDTQGIACAVSVSVIRGIMSRYAQFSALRISTTLQIWLCDLAKITPGHAVFRALEFLEHDAHAEDNDEIPNVHWLWALTNMSCLKALKIIGPWYGDTEDPDPQWWCRLQHVVVHDYCGTLLGLRVLLEKCPRLATFRLSSYPHSFEDEEISTASSGDPILLEHLLQLEVAYLSPSPASRLPGTKHPLVALLPHIKTPHITGLVIEDHELNAVDNGHFQSSMTSFLQQSGNGIRSLKMSIWGSEDEDNSRPDFLDYLQHVQQLVITPSKAATNCDDFLSNIYEGRYGHRILFPKLKHLRILDVQFDPVLLVDLISSRQRSAAALQAQPAADKHTDFLTCVEIQTLRIPDLRNFVETAVNAGLSSCTLDPSFIIRFDPAEFVALDSDNRQQWPFDN